MVSPFAGIVLKAAGSAQRGGAAPGHGRALAGERDTAQPRPKPRETGARPPLFFGFFELLKEQTFVFGFKKNGFTVPFLGLKPL